jgi:ligand-binding sensor domain-containing protein
MVLLMLAACSDDSNTGAPDEDAAAKASSASSAPATAVPNTDKGGYRLLDSFNVGDNVYVRSMAIDTNTDSLWVGTSVGVLEVDLATRNLSATYTREQGLANEYVFGMHVDQKGNRWFGTNGGGISRYSPDRQWKTFFPLHGLADYWVYSFAEQSDGTLWIGTWAGLSRFDPEQEKFHTYLTELVNEWVYGLDVDSRDRVWIGTEGGVNMFNGKTWETWTHEEGLGAANAQNLPLSTNTGLGTRSRHDLSVMSEGMATYNPNYVFDLLVAQDDTVWAGTWGGGISHFNGEAWTNYSTQDGLAGNVVYSVAQDVEGNMWFGTNGGLSYFDGNTWRVFTQEDGLLDNNIYAIMPTANGQLWVGSRSGVVLLGQAANPQ